MNDELEVAGLGVLMQRLAHDQQALLDNVAQSLGTALPAAVRTARRGLFNRGRVHRVEVFLGDAVFELREERGQVHPHVGHAVGGVVLSRRPIAVDAWISGLREALARAAAESEDVRAALARFAS